MDLKCLKKRFLLKIYDPYLVCEATSVMGSLVSVSTGDSGAGDMTVEGAGDMQGEHTDGDDGGGVESRDNDISARRRPEYHITL